MIRIGETYGPFLVLEQVERGHNSPNGWVQARFRVRCTRCGSTSRKTYSALLLSESNHQASCGNCNHRRVVSGRVAQRFCKACFNMSWVRPPEGCRKCKQPYAPENAPAAEMYRGRSNIADCESC